MTNPRAILAPFVSPGMTVLEPGPGMGFFTLELAELVGPQGRVIAVDIQPRMVRRLRNRAERAGMDHRIETHIAAPSSLGIGNLPREIDFTLAFAVVHEMPDTATFFREVAAASRPGAKLLLAEPNGHVKADRFNQELRAAEEAGFSTASAPSIRGHRTALFEKR